jgi:hypothetical protein
MTRFQYQAHVAFRLACYFQEGVIAITPAPVPFRTGHLLGVVVNWPSVWPDR